MNLLINNYCNFKCSYCFAQEEMHSKDAMNITMDNFCVYLDWLKNNGDRYVRLIGGEPSLHPNLEGLIDKVIEYDCFDNILIFTNLSFPFEIAQMLVEKNQYITISLLPNINEFNLLIPRYRNNIIQNLDYLTTALPHFDRISINIYSPDQNLDFWEDIVCKYNIKSVRWSIVVPNEDLEDNFDVKQYFHQFQSILLNFADWSRKYHIDLDCDCSAIPLCALDDWAIVKILKVAPLFFARRTCEEPVIDIAPNLEVRGCFGCRGMSTKPLQEFTNYSDIYNFFNKDREQLHNNLARKECLGCSRYLMLGESCTCLGYRNIPRSE